MTEQPELRQARLRGFGPANKEINPGDRVKIAEGSMIYPKGGGQGKAKQAFQAIRLKALSGNEMAAFVTHQTVGLWYGEDREFTGIFHTPIKNAKRIQP